MKRHIVPMLVALTLAALLSGCGENTAAPTAVTPLDEAPPAAPTDVVRVQDTDLPSGRLQWAPSPSPNVAEYQIFRFEPSPDREDSYVLVGQTDAGTTNYPLPATYAPSTFYYRLKAVSPTGVKSEWSETATIRIGMEAPPDQNPDDPGALIPVKH